MASIYLKSGNKYVAMSEQLYDAESVLQELIAQHPEVLLDGEADQHPLMLVRQEAGVGLAENESRWRLDHLYLDAEGVPTLVEVKRSSDTRGRREVVAQMLDYAANAKTSFSVDRMIEWLAAAAGKEGLDVAHLLEKRLGVTDSVAYWERVTANLGSEHMRLIFVADEIKPELQRIIEFLNGQMTNTDVLAIEVKQYIDADRTQQTIVPRVIGNTSDAQLVKRRTRAAPETPETLATALRRVGADQATAGLELLPWIEGHPELKLTWLKDSANAQLPGGGRLLRIWTSGLLEVGLRALRESDPAWTSERIERLVSKLETSGRLKFSDGHEWRYAPIQPLSDADARGAFQAVIDEALRSTS